MYRHTYFPFIIIKIVSMFIIMYIFIFVTVFVKTCLLMFILRFIFIIGLLWLLCMLLSFTMHHVRKMCVWVLMDVTATHSSCSSCIECIFVKSLLRFYKLPCSSCCSMMCCAVLCDQNLKPQTHTKISEKKQMQSMGCVFKQQLPRTKTCWMPACQAFV